MYEDSHGWPATERVIDKDVTPETILLVRLELAGNGCYPRHPELENGIWGGMRYFA